MGDRVHRLLIESDRRLAHHADGIGGGRFPLSAPNVSPYCACCVGLTDSSAAAREAGGTRILRPANLTRYWCSTFRPSGIWYDRALPICYCEMSQFGQSAHQPVNCGSATTAAAAAGNVLVTVTVAVPPIASSGICRTSWFDSHARSTVVETHPYDTDAAPPVAVSVTVHCSPTLSISEFADVASPCALNVIVTGEGGGGAV